MGKEAEKAGEPNGCVRVEAPVRRGRAQIVERTGPDGRTVFVIQQRHFLFRWWWVDAWINAWEGTYCQDSFFTLEEAKKHLCYFDGTPTRERVIVDA